jgi:exopolysaccharide biosynthesis protein
VRDGSEWTIWWRSDQAPSQWTGAGALASRLRLRPGAAGVVWGELSLAGAAEAWRTRVVVAVIDPARVRLALDTAYVDREPSWRVGRFAADTSVVLAVNAGQFVQTLPWGWVVLDGAPYLAAGAGPLVSSIVVDAQGAVHWSHGDAPSRTGTLAGVAYAFQSYPTLLREGVVPAPLRAPDRGIDVRHRDARLAIGRLADGRLLIAMTRFDGLGRAVGRLPLGLTVPEMAAVMGALGARDAVMLDGGISAQLMVRERSGKPRLWPGLRAVPLALVARTRS